MSEREQALAGLREFQQEAATLRAALRRYEVVLGRVHRQVERGAPLHEVMGKIGVSDLRAELVERLDRFEEARGARSRLPSRREERRFSHEFRPV